MSVTVNPTTGMYDGLHRLGSASVLCALTGSLEMRGWQGEAGDGII